MKDNAIFMVIAVTVIAGIGGSVAAPEQTNPILGFCGIVTGALIGKLVVVKLNDIKAVTDKTHDLANSKQGNELAIAALAATTLAAVKPTPQYERAAELARDKVKEHDLVQAIADGKKQSNN